MLSKKDAYVLIGMIHIQRPRWGEMGKAKMRCYRT